MKAVKIIFNILGIILAIILSVALYAVLVAAPIVSVSSSLLQPEMLHNVVQQVDYEALIEANPDLSGTLQEYGMDTETITAILESDAVEEAMDLYMDDIFAAIEGVGKDPKLTPEAIKQIAADHMDEIVEIAKNYKDPSADVATEEIEAQITQVVEEYADDVVELLPAPMELSREIFDEVSEEQAVVMESVQILHNGILETVLLIVAIVLSVLIVLCRIKRFKGFMWLGVVYCLASFICLGGALTMGSLSVLVTEVEMSPWMLQLMESASKVLSGAMMTRGLILIGLAVLFIAVFIVGRIIFVKKREKHTT